MGNWPKHLCGNKLAKTNSPGSRRNSETPPSGLRMMTLESLLSPTDSEHPAGVTNSQKKQAGCRLAACCRSMLGLRLLVPVLSSTSCSI